MYVFIGIILYLSCGVIAAGIRLPYIRKDSSESFRSDLGESLLFGLVFGPIGLIIALFNSGFCEHGWRLWDERKRQD